jgi:conjugal transfer pilus assembly protein TraF
MLETMKLIRRLFNHIAIFVALFFILVPRQDSADVVSGISKSYNDDSRRGWWWYEVEPEKKDDDKKEVKPARALPSMKDYTGEQLWNMHPDDFQPLIKDFLKKAVQTPTIENVRDFYVMVDIARLKSHAFQAVAGEVWQKYPEFSLDNDIPVNAYGRVAKTRMIMKETEDRLNAAASDFALIYFYSDGCEFCKAQSEVIDYFVAKHGWEVKRVEIGERPDLAARFDVKMTPYLMLIYRISTDYFPVSIGVSTLPEIEERVYHGIRLLSGETSPESFSMYDFQRGGKLDPSGYTRSGSDSQQ